MRSETGTDQCNDRTEQISPGNQQETDVLVWQKGKPNKKLTETLTNLMTMLGVVVSKEIKSIEKQIKDMQKVAE